jgi:hypothetical protein
MRSEVLENELSLRDELLQVRACRGGSKMEGGGGGGVGSDSGCAQAMASVRTVEYFMTI